MRTAELAAAYADCRVIAKREAKNFYYGFMALPRGKSDAMCAVYAFMRRADDISDDESKPVAKRREELARWLHAFHAGESVDVMDRPVFLAVRDVQQRFQISDALLDELVAGTAMDLAEEAPAGVVRVEQGGTVLDVYMTTEALEQYCYLVASVVGLVTIRIFGYVHPATEDLAIAMGKAFQFTNILRDVKEDAERGRIYLPLQLLREHGSSVEDVLRAARGEAASTQLLNAMRALAAQAEQFYSVQRDLVRDLEPESRGAMRTLVEIYHRLLLQIQSRNFGVFRERVRVSAPQKIGILLRGMLFRSAV